MFTATNVAATSASAGGVGPVATAVPAPFQIISNTSVNGSSGSSSTLSSSSSSSVSTSSSPTAGPQTWRFTSLNSSIIKQPSVVSIRNGATTLTTPMNSTGITIPANTSIIRIQPANTIQCHPAVTTNTMTTTTGNLIIQTPQSVRLVSAPLHTSSSAPALNRLNNSNMTINTNVRQLITSTATSSSSSTAPPPPPSSSTAMNFKPGFCVDTPILGRLGPITLQLQNTQPTLIQSNPVVSLENRNPLPPPPPPPVLPPLLSQQPTVEPPRSQPSEEQTTNPNGSSGENDDQSLMNCSQDQELEIFVNNVVCSFSLGCSLDLRKIAKEAANVIYKRDQAMVLMKIRKPYCSANIWSSGKVTVTGATSEDDAHRGARRIARSIQRLGYKVRFRHYRVVNCLATCSMPWYLDIVKLNRMYPECVSYEPEIHPGATVRLSGNAVLKVFTTGNITLTAPSVDRINSAVNEFYPQLYECRKGRRDERQC